MGNNHKIVLPSLLIIMTAILYIKCTGPANNAGTATETENVTAMLYNPGGSPAARAIVRFYKCGSDPRNNSGDSTITITDIHGNYAINLDTGTYNILARGDSGMALMDSFTVINGEIAHPPADTLKAPGSIKGIVQLQPGDDARTVFILFIGTHIFTMPSDDTGHFTTDNIAEGNYSVRILTTTPNYKVLDTNLSVAAGTQNVLPRPIILQFAGIPVPTGLRISYDTLKQVATLTWRKADTSLVKGYNVYRRNIDSSFGQTPINGTTLVMDTVYRDSTGTQEITYEYKVVSIDKGDNAGKLSEGATVTIATYFHVDSLFGSYGTGPGQFEGLTGIAVDRNGNLYIADSTTNRIQMFNSGMVYQFEIDSPKVIIPNGLAVDSTGNIYSIVNRSSNIIKVFSPSGALIDSIVLAEDSGFIADICIHNNELFLLTLYDTSYYFSDSIIVMNLDGTTKRSWTITGGRPGGLPEYISINDSGYIFITTEYNGIHIFDSIGNFKTSIMQTIFSPKAKIVFDSKGRIIANQSGSELWLIDNRDYHIIAKYDLHNRMSSGSYNEAGRICSITTGGKDLIYVELLGASNKILKLLNLFP